MAEEAIDPIETPETCETTIEYDNRIEDDFEIDPEDEVESSDYGGNLEEIEQQFARYERNYRARRIRELTRGPLARRRVGRLQRASRKRSAV